MKDVPEQEIRAAIADESQPIQNRRALVLELARRKKEAAAAEELATTSQAAPKEKKNRTPMEGLQDFMFTSMQGPTLSMGEDVMARSLAAVQNPFSEKSYEELRDFYLGDMRSRIDSFTEDHPYASFFGQLGASLVPAATIAKPVAAAYKTLEKAAPAAMNMVKNLPGFVKTTAVAAPATATYGFGEGEGLEDRLDKAQEFGQMGLVFGPAAHYVGAGLNKGAKVVNSLLNLNPSTPSAVGETASSMAEEASKTSLGAKAKDLVRKGFEFLGADDLDAKAIAERRILGNLSEDYDGLPHEELIPELERYLQTKKKPVSIAETTNQDNMRQLGETVAQYPGRQVGKANKFFNERQKGVEVFPEGVVGSQGERIMKDLEPILGKGKTYDQALSDVLTRRKAKAGPLYEQLASETLEPTDQLLSILQKMPKEAFAYGNKIAKLKGTKAIDLEKILKDMEEGVMPESFSMRDLDLIKQGMDDYVNDVFANQKARGLGGVAKELRDEFRNYLDEAGTDTYKQARAAYAGESAIKEALERGRDILGKDYDPKFIDKLGDSEKEAYRLGAYQAIQDFTGQTIRGANKADRLLNKEDLVDRYVKLFGNEDEFNLFLKNIKQEDEMAKYGQRVLGNSATARRESYKEQFSKDNLDEGMKDLGRMATPRTMAQWVGDFAQKLKDINIDLNKYVAEEAGDLLFKELDPDTIDILSRRIQADKALSAEQKLKATAYIKTMSEATNAEKIRNEKASK